MVASSDMGTTRTPSLLTVRPAVQVWLMVASGSRLLGTAGACGFQSAATPLIHTSSPSAPMARRSIRGSFWL